MFGRDRFSGVSTLEMNALGDRATHSTKFDVI